MKSIPADENEISSSDRFVSLSPVFRNALLIYFYVPVLYLTAVCVGARYGREEEEEREQNLPYILKRRNLERIREITRRRANGKGLNSKIRRRKRNLRVRCLLEKL